MTTAKKPSVLSAIKHVEKKRKQHQRTQLVNQQIGVASTLLGTASGTATVTSICADDQIKRFNKKLWNPLFSHTENANTPLNKMVFICAHNSGSEGGSGTRLINQSQTLSPYQLLESTPTRALEFQVENDHGTYITNHGAALGEMMINRGISQPETLSSQLNSVRDWLSKSNHQDQVIVIQLANNATTAKDQAAINALIQNTFGAQLFNMNDYYKAEMAGRWPTVNELVDDNKHVVVLASGMGYYDATIPSHHVMTELLNPNATAPAAMQWHAIGEDRTLAGNLVGGALTSGLSLDKQFVGSLNTQQVDQVIQNSQGHGAFIKLDQLAPNDPRLVTPELRPKLAANPNVSLFGGLIQVDSGLAASVTFGVGVTSSVGATTFALIESGLKAYRNFKFIQDAPHHFREHLAKASLVDLTEFQRRKYKIKTPYPINLSEEELSAYCREQMIDKITTDTVMAGALGTTSIAAGTFSFGLLFPPFFPVTAFLAVVTLTFGVIFTSLFSYYNRLTLNQKLDELLNLPETQQLIQNKKNILKEAINPADVDHYAKKAREKHKDSTLGSASNYLLASSLLLRVSAMAKYSIALMGTIASGLTTIGMYFRSALDAVINYRNRQKLMDNLPAFLIQAALPPIDTRAYLFFGETRLEHYIRTHHSKLQKDFGLSAEEAKLPPRELVYQLNANNKMESYNALRKAAISHEIAEDLARYCKAHKEKYQPENPSLIKKYLLSRLESHIDADVKASGRFNAFKLALATWIGGTFFAPFLSVVFAGLGLGILVVSEVVTRLVAKREVHKFKDTASLLLSRAQDELKPTDPATAEVSHFLEFLGKELEQEKHEHERDLKGKMRARSTHQKLHAHLAQNKTSEADKTTAHKAAPKKHPHLFAKRLSRDNLEPKAAAPHSPKSINKKPTLE